MKKILPVITAIILALTMGACGAKVTTPPKIEEVPNGYIRGKILTDSGAMTTAGIIVEDSAGGRARYTTNPLSGFQLSLAPGDYTLYFTRGAEFSVESKDITVESMKVVYLNDVRLNRLYDTYAKGYFAGDLHQHTIYSDGANAVNEVLYSNISQGLYFGFLSDHNSARGLSEWVQANRATADIDPEGYARMFGAFEAVEVTTEFGHYQSLGVGLTFDQYEVVLREAERSLPKAQKDEIIKERIKYIGRTITREGGLAQINHPYSSGTMGFNYWDVADYFETIEIWNGVYVPGDGRYESANVAFQTANYKAKLKWFELLNAVKDGGKFHAATGGTDNHEVASVYKGGEVGSVTDMEGYEKLYARNGKYSGVPTTYVRLDGEMTQQNVLNALKAGNSFVSNAPVAIADIDGKSYGETAAAQNGKVKFNLEVFNRDGIEKIRIVKNGVTALEFTTEETLYRGEKELDAASGDWFAIEVLGTGTQYAITNPIFIG